jgi:hypothetical protein
MSLKVKTALMILFPVLAFHFYVLSGEGQTDPGPDHLQVAKKLAGLEVDYFQKKIHNDWKGLYDYQHPDYKKHISIEEFQFFEGRVLYNYREENVHHVSGGLTPSLDFIMSNPEKKDVLGFPIPRKYRWFANPFVTIKGYELKRVSISENGNYAMVEVELRGTEQLNPAVVRDDIKFDIKKPHVDYWEKVDGAWKISMLADAASVSGGVKVHYFIPNSNDAWEKMKFIAYVPRPKPKDVKK